MSLLTTITPYWKRPDMLRNWVRSILGSTIPELRHLIYFVGEAPPDWWASETAGTNITALVREEAPGFSIGHYHNLGAHQAQTEWIMKLDVDTMAHTSYFTNLLPVLQKAHPREWFNGGMFYMARPHSEIMLPLSNLPLPERIYDQIMSQRRTYSSSSYILPAATNFICRKEDYLKLGGCDAGFRGYGWEDYQQIYMLERYQARREPLPGIVTLQNVTARCRDEISRRKARQLWERNPRLCLIHKWHAVSVQSGYHSNMNQNRELLLGYINRLRKSPW